MARPGFALPPFLWPNQVARSNKLKGSQFEMDETTLKGVGDGIVDGWFNLACQVIAKHVPQARIVDLGLEEGAQAGG